MSAIRSSGWIWLCLSLYVCMTSLCATVSVHLLLPYCYVSWWGCCSGGSQFNPNCMIQGYNLSAFSGVDVFGYDDLGYAYAMRLCGTAGTCNGYSATSSAQSMICQWDPTATSPSATPLSVSSYAVPSSSITSRYVTPFIPSSGVQLTVPNIWLVPVQLTVSSV